MRNIVSIVSSCPPIMVEALQDIIIERVTPNSLGHTLSRFGLLV